MRLGDSISKREKNREMYNLQFAFSIVVNPYPPIFIGF